MTSQSEGADAVPAPRDFQSDYSQLERSLERQRRRTRLGALLPFAFALLVILILLPFVLVARTGANKASQAEDEAQRQVAEHPELLPQANPRDPALVIRELYVALALAKRANPQPPDKKVDHQPQSTCLPSDVANACSLMLGPNKMVVLFSTNSSELSPTSQAVLRRELLCRSPQSIASVSIDGYADSRLSRRNATLSFERARVTAAFVRESLALSRDTLFAPNGHGAAFPEAFLANAPLECQRSAVITLVER